MPPKRRLFQSSPEWDNIKDEVGYETVMMPVTLQTDIISKMFFLQRILGQAPHLLVKNSPGIFFPAPAKPARSVLLYWPNESHRYNLWDGDLVPESRELGCQKVIDVLTCYPNLSLMLRGLLQNAGRNELTWVQVDSVTMKKQLSGPETTFFRFFQEHPLAEKQLLFEIVRFLV